VGGLAAAMGCPPEKQTAGRRDQKRPPPVGRDAARPPFDADSITTKRWCSEAGQATGSSPPILRRQPRQLFQLGLLALIGSDESKNLHPEQHTTVVPPWPSPLISKFTEREVLEVQLNSVTRIVP
jgi:hypothetical protein